tara:strand:- start:5 stop:445 length:441 start_codon:yes stop_codon:yes gene_type:complete
VVEHQSQFVHERRVSFSETDMAGIVHFSNYYRYMEEAEHAYFRSLDLKIMHRREDGIIVGWPRVSSHCQYLGPARYEDILQITVDIERLGVKSVSWSMGIYCGDRKLAQGRMKTACCLCRADHTLESIPIASPYVEKLEESPFLQT